MYHQSSPVLAVLIHGSIQVSVLDLAERSKLYNLIERSGMFFRPLACAGSQRNLGDRGRSPRFSAFPRDTANVDGRQNHV